MALDAFRYQWKYLRHASDASPTMQLWIKAASALPHADDVCRSVVGTLLEIAPSELSQHIPMVAWDWLNKRPVLPPESVELLPRAVESTVRRIQQLGDVKLIVSYLHIVWSEWRPLEPDDRRSRALQRPQIRHKYHDMSVMRRLIREELGGIGAAGHRTDLVWRLDYVLLQLDLGYGSTTKQKYEELRSELLGVDEEAMKILTGTSSARRPFFVY